MPFKSDRQRRFFQAVAHGMKPTACGCEDKVNCSCGPTKSVARKAVDHDLGRQRKMANLVEQGY